MVFQVDDYVKLKGTKHWRGLSRCSEDQWKECKAFNSGFKLNAGDIFSLQKQPDILGNKPRYEIEGWYFDEEDLELVSKVFKPGDKVTALQAETFGVGTILEERYAGTFVVEFENLKIGHDGYGSYDKGINNRWCFNKSNLTKILDNNKYNLEDKKMELKELKKENLTEAMNQYNIEKSNEEIEFAKKRIRELNNRKDTLQREIKARQTEVDTIDSELSIFQNKK